jgi:hypothetical protein
MIIEPPRRPPDEKSRSRDRTYGRDVQRDAGLALGDLPQDVDLLLQVEPAEDRPRTGGPFEPKRGAYSSPPEPAGRWRPGGAAEHPPTASSPTAPSTPRRTPPAQPAPPSRTDRAFPGQLPVRDGGQRNARSRAARNGSHTASPISSMASGTWIAVRESFPSSRISPPM